MDVASRTILVVEDDAMVLMGLQMILETWGMSVRAASDLPGVLAHLEDGDPQLVLSDLNLGGGLSGFDVVERVRAQAGADVPAIILTGETGKAEGEEGRRRNVTFLVKPIQADALRRAIAEVVG